MALANGGPGWPRRVRIGLTVAGAVGLLLLGVIIWNGGHLPPWHPFVEHRDPPPASAPITTVATAYLDAAERRDCALTQELTVGGGSGWCDDIGVTDWRGLGAPGKIPDGAGGECMTIDRLRVDPQYPSVSGHVLDGWELCLRHTRQGWRVDDWGQG